MQPNINRIITEWQRYWHARFWRYAVMSAAAHKRLESIQQANHKNILEHPANPASYCPDAGTEAAQRVYEFYHSRALLAFEHLAALNLATLAELKEMQSWL